MIWNTLRHFKITERWGNPGEMNGLLLILLDEIRDRYGCQFIVVCGYAASGHVNKSQHYLGNAVDFYIKTSDTYHEQILKIEKILKELQVDDVVGLGIYPQSNSKIFHLDVRGTFARWGYLYKDYCSYELARDWAYKHPKEEK
ncbi:MAG: DUF882 domain-containing protein [Spirochaetes bacterium]|nr:DUF882 domain-containing protein [Spirochaetota bacterium]